MARSYCKTGQRWACAMGTCACLIAFLVSFTASSHARAQSVTETVVDTDKGTVESTEYSLSNGLRVVLAPDPHVHGVVLVVRYAVGSAHDPKDYSGLAHLFEHLTFRGSRHLRPKQSAELIEAQGGGYNGFTSLEHTTYYTTLPSRALELGLWIESERMGFALDGIDETALRLESRIVKNEYSQRHGLGGLVWSQLARVLYGENHPFAKEEGASSRDTDGISLRDVQWFGQTSYRPDNATLVLVGDFELAAGRALVERYFSALRNPKLAHLLIHAPAPKLCGVHRLELSHGYLLGSQMSITWPVPVSQQRSQRMALETVRQILTERAREALTRTTPVATNVSASIEYYRSHGLFSIAVELIEPTELAQTEPVIVTLVNELMQAPLSAAELSAWRSKLLTDASLAREQLLRRPFSILDGADVARDPQDIAALDVESIQRAASLLGQMRVVVNTQYERGVDDISVSDEENPCP